MKDIREYFDYLFSLERSSMKYDLKNIRLLLKKLGNPHVKTKFIHIAGTNGKGGTASFLASILKEHGLKTGLFTSPHILRFNERIRINGKPISNGYIKKFLYNNKRLIQKVKPSFFEVNAAMAFKYFADKKVDIAVIETGLGGRLDSTNVIQPELIIITQIGIDHTDYLGKTLKSIAEEKLGIVKPGVDVIAADRTPELRKLFNGKVENKHLFFLDEHSEFKIIKKSLSGINFKSRINFSKNKYNIRFSSPLPGIYQIMNINTAIMASHLFLEKCGMKLSVSRLRRAVEKLRQNTGYRGRFELLKIGGIRFILDISHNPSGINEAMTNFGKEKPDFMIFAMMNDKDYKEALRILIKKGTGIIFTQPEYKRALPAKTLYDFAARINPKAMQMFYLKPDVKEAVKFAQETVGNEGTVLIIGSFFLVSEAIKVLKVQKLFV